jgi:hypothetical protein
MERKMIRKRKSENHQFLKQCSKQTKFSNASLETLPTELILKILTYISTPCLITNVSRVSHTFYNLSKDIHLDVKITSEMDPTKVTNFVKERCEKITKLTLHRATFKMLDSLTPCLAYLTRLDSVKIVGLGSRFPAGFLSSLYTKDSLKQVTFN